MTDCPACLTSRLNAKKAGHRDGQGVCFEHAGVTLPPLDAVDVVIGMETSGAVRGACLKQGLDAISVDLLPHQSGGPHHQAKTKAEARIRGKVNRIVKRENGERRQRPEIPARRFGSVTRKMDGSLGMTAKARRAEIERGPQ